jgi:GNAT superfamily N-acetyltransferase
MKRLSERLLRRTDLTVRPVKKQRLDDEIRIARDIYNSAWEKNWGFVPMTDEEFQWQSRKLKPVLVPELALIAEVEGKPAAFALSLPNLNQALAPTRGRLFPFGLFKFLWHQRKIDSIRVITFGVRKEFRGLGIEGLLIQKTVEAGLARGYRWADLSWILEDNAPMRRIVEKMGARLYKRFEIWEAGVEELLT